MTSEEELLEFSFEDTDEAWSKWEEPREYPPPPPAVDKDHAYKGQLVQIRESRIDVYDGKPVFSAVCDVKIIGGPYHDRLITFVRLNTRVSEFTGSSLIIDLARVVGAKENPTRRAQAFLEDLVASGKSFYFTFKWSGTCTECRDQALLKVTGLNDTKEAWKALTKKDRKVVQEAGLKAKGYKNFPLAKTQVGGKEYRLDFFSCPSCHARVNARGEIRNFVLPPTISGSNISSSKVSSSEETFA